MRNPECVRENFATACLVLMKSFSVRKRHTFAFDAFARDRGARRTGAGAMGGRGNSVLLVIARPKIEKFLVVLVYAFAAQTRTTRNDIEWNARLPTVRMSVRSVRLRSDGSTREKGECHLKVKNLNSDLSRDRWTGGKALFKTILFALLTDEYKRCPFHFCTVGNIDPDPTCDKAALHAALQDA